MPTTLEDLKLHASGKVREIYEDGDELIMVASDRISVYDVVLPTDIPDKGKVLTQMSLFWFELTSDIVPNHLISDDVPEEVREAMSFHPVMTIGEVLELALEPARESLPA